jgi:murein L,D-transpeptidase YcbB/YkuD
MLLGGDYLVIQEGGEGSALGRIIFRFDNKFSVYLHSTSQPGVFSREDRGVSHGCIRVEKPFDLAVFMLEKKDPKVIRKIGYSMQADVSPLGKRREDMSEEQQQVADTLQRNLLVGNIVVKPRVPLYILYFTLYPDANGNLRQYSDVYGYDRVTYDYLRNFI